MNSVWLKTILVYRRPLFAKEALKYIEQSPFSGIDGNDEVDYLDRMVEKLGPTYVSYKSENQWFLRGQVCMFLCTSFIIQDKSNLIHGHYAFLNEENEPFGLNFYNGKIVKNQEKAPWISQSKFPSIKDDVLLYLALMGGKHFSAFKDIVNENDIRFTEAMEKVKMIEIYDDNTNAKSSDGMRMESLMTGCVIHASPMGGLGGISSGAFLSALLYEVGMKTSRKDDVDYFSTLKLASCIKDMKIHFLSPPNVKWPDFLYGLNLDLANFDRTENKYKIDMAVTVRMEEDQGAEETMDAVEEKESIEDVNKTPKRWTIQNSKSNILISGECKDWSTHLKLEPMEAILQRIPKSTRIHLVFTNELQGSYYTNVRERVMKCFDEFVKTTTNGLERACFEWQYLYTNLR